MEGSVSKCLVRAILAGVCISIGGCVDVGSEVKWVGAILFAVGLSTILLYGFDLYTGKVGYIVENDRSFIPKVALILVGNFIGTLAVGLMIPMEGAEALALRKLESFEFLPTLFKGVMCGMLMFIAADTYKHGKGLVPTFFCVPVFILAGFEHSIADMFYFCSGMVFNLDALAFILVVALGNAIGGMLIPLGRKYMYEKPGDGIQDKVEKADS